MLDQNHFLQRNSLPVVFHFQPEKRKAIFTSINLFTFNWILQSWERTAFEAVFASTHSLTSIYLQREQVFHMKMSLFFVILIYFEVKSLVKILVTVLHLAYKKQKQIKEKNQEK